MLDNYDNWPELELPGSLQNINGLNNFNGVFIIKNEFLLIAFIIIIVLIWEKFLLVGQAN